MRYEVDMTTDEFLDEDGREELNYEPSEPDGVAPPLIRLPPDPYRSLGGFLNYAGWPDCERMMELDRAIRSRAPRYAGRQVDSEIRQRPRRRRLTWSVGGMRRENKYQPAAYDS